MIILHFTYPNGHLCCVYFCLLHVMPYSKWFTFINKYHQKADQNIQSLTVGTEAYDLKACPNLWLSSELWLEDKHNVLYFVNLGLQVKKKPSSSEMKTLENLLDHAGSIMPVVTVMIKVLASVMPLQRPAGNLRMAPPPPPKCTACFPPIASQQVTFKQ